MVGVFPSRLQESSEVRKRRYQPVTPRRWENADSWSSGSRVKEDLCQIPLQICSGGVRGLDTGFGQTEVVGDLNLRLFWE